MGRRQQRRAEKARRHAQPPWPAEPAWPTEAPYAAKPPRVVVREASYVERLAYTRSQAAEALGISRSTFIRRVLPYVETIEMPWGAKLIPVDELERLVGEGRRAGAAQRQPAARGRKTVLTPELVASIRQRRLDGESFAEIARRLNVDEIRTAHGGRQWWPSTIRAVLIRSGPPQAGRSVDHSIRSR